VLLRPTLAVRAGVALAGTDNWQNLAPAWSDAWTLIGLGTLERVLPRHGVQIRPNPFNAARGQRRSRSTWPRCRCRSQ